MKLAIKTQQQSTWWHWSVLILGGLGVTYLWLWMLAYSPVHRPITDWLALDVILEIPHLNIIEESAAEPASVPQPTPVETVMQTIVPATLRPKVVVSVPVPVPVAAAQKTARLQDAPPATVSTLNATPVVNMPQPATPVPPSSEPVPVSRLTRTPTFVHKVLPNDPEDVQIPPGGVRVIARITLDETAIVRNVAIDQSSDAAFDGAVIAAIHRSRFTPGYIGDHPVATVFNQTYRFQLQ